MSREDRSVKVNGGLLLVGKRMLVNKLLYLI